MARAWPLAVLAMLAPLWLVGTLHRDAWTPDEPREADIVWRMARQSDRALPNFAGSAFLEKPPLSYWMAAGSSTLFGDSVRAARVPNILYAAITALSIGTLAFVIAGPYAALLAALVACSALTMLRVTIWLAPDACLLAGCSIALLGAYLGYTARPGIAKLVAYTMMHAGAALGFMAKSAPGWLVPALALLTLIAWERRWTELRRPELYAGLLLQALIIAPWIAAVAHSPDGANALRVLFWDNLTGRFASVASASGADYATGHRNWPGRYLVELPFSLLPWTVCVIAALRAAWTRARATDALSTAWRFGVSATLPFLLLLSVAATARDIYAAPAVLGMSLLVALWASELRGSLGALDRIALRATRGLVIGIAAVLALFACLLALAKGGDSSALLWAGAALIVALVVPLSRFAARLDADGARVSGLIATYAAFSIAVALGGLAVFPAIDRWQDLPALGRAIQRDSADRDLALLQPDETTIAMLDNPLRTPFVILPATASTQTEVVAEWFRKHPTDGRVLVMLPNHAPGELSRLIARWRPLPRPNDGVAAELERAGVARLLVRYELPHGRRYALLAPPPTALQAHADGALQGRSAMELRQPGS